jgi:hypothetical protein
MNVRITALAAVVLCVGGAEAQGRPHTRQGFTVGFGIGLGFAEVSCESCAPDRAQAGAAYFRFGFTIRPDLILASEVSSATRDRGSGEMTITAVDFVALYYPAPVVAFYLLGGVGSGALELTSQAGATSGPATGGGIGYELGGGYDWRIAKNFSLTPSVTYFRTRGVKVEGKPLDGTVLMLGLGVTWH